MSEQLKDTVDIAVDSLSGVMLDRLVAKVAGMPVMVSSTGHRCTRNDFSDPLFMSPYYPSSSWVDGGPLIDRYQVSLIGMAGAWRASLPEMERDANGEIVWIAGRTQLEAAMRAIVIAHVCRVYGYHRPAIAQMGLDDYHKLRDRT